MTSSQLRPAHGIITKNKQNGKPKAKKNTCRFFVEKLGLLMVSSAHRLDMLIVAKHTEWTILRTCVEGSHSTTMVLLAPAPELYKLLTN